VNKIERLTNIILLLQERARTSNELSELLEVSRRTILRDVEALCFIGVPIIAQGGIGGGYSLAGEYSIAPLRLTWREAILLRLAITSLSKMSDSPFSNERASLSAKLAAILPSHQNDQIAEYLGKIEIATPERRKAPLLDALVEASGSGQSIELRYDGDGTVISVSLRPDRVFADRGFWYVEGISDGKRRWFRADRVVSFKPSDKVEVEPLPYDHASHPCVRVRLSGRGLRVAERDPHFGDAVRQATANGGLLEFRCPPEELDWYARYFGGMGVDAVVEAPPELVVRIRVRIAELKSIYDA
jgi:predicted DNA-binding transcriptional regulator YafY